MLTYADTAIPTPPRSPSPTPNPVRICVTGAAGLVGSQLCQYLLSVGHSVVALDIVPTDSPKLAIRPESTKRYKYIVGSAEDYEIYRDACRGCDGIVHLAAVYTRPERPVPAWRVHNANVAMSYNTLSIAVELGINRVAMASSVNAIGMLYSQRPKYDYLPLDESHPCRPEDAYSVAKYFCELQSESFVRRFPSLRIATLRFHAVVPMSHVSPSSLNALGGAWKDLWGWVSNLAVARSCLLSLTAPTETFPEGTHEAFFIVAPTICQQKKTQELLEGMYPEWKSDEMKIHLRRPFTSNEGLFDCSKAERMLGWRENGYYMET
nr:hypothetical protein L203_00629 [Cryptococcus depauperatus CBS 7841]ODO02378.1 hypothetical protein L204_01111 [Cryptococcus depauperatus CBS 7855]